MHPDKIFEKRLIDNPEVCNYCFRRKAHLESVPEEAPDMVSPRLATTEDGETVYPPGNEKERHFIDIDWEFLHGRFDFDGSHNSNWWENTTSGVGRKRPVVAIGTGPGIACSCGYIDDNRIDGEFPDDWEDRPKEKLENVALRVYNRVEEEGFDVDYDGFFASLREYKASKEFDEGDYEILKKSVADSVSVQSE